MSKKQSIGNSKPDTKNLSQSCLKLDKQTSDLTEHLKRVEVAAPNFLLEEAKKNKSDVENRLENSERELNELIDFGRALITNIQISSSKRELDRRLDEENELASMQQKFQQDSIETFAYYNVIKSKWSELQTLNEPMCLFEQLEDQKQRLAEYIVSQNKIIEQCQEVIERLNQKYSFSQNKQALDITSLVERIDYQIELIKEAYNDHINQLESTADTQRKDVIVAATNKWETYLKAFTDNEIKKINDRRERDNWRAENIQKVCLEQEEITQQTQIKLDRDAEILELELRNTKNNMFINSEKLDYNFRVLQIRNEEAGFINNQQKRRLTKIYETISLLKKNLQNTRSNFSSALQKLTADIQKLHHSINVLVTRTDQYRLTNQNKLNAVWDINFLEVVSRVTTIVKIDKVLYEEQLGIEWIEPSLKYDNLISIRNIFRTSPPNTSNQKIYQHNSENEKPRDVNIQEMNFLTKIIKQISNRAEFIVEKNILRILEPFTDKDKDIVRLENIFNALNVTKPEEITALIKYFLPYAWCDNCMNTLTKRNIAKEMISFHSIDLMDNDQILDQHKSCTNHNLIIKPVFVLTILKKLMEKNFNIMEERKNAENLQSLSSLDKPVTLKFDPIAEKEKVRLFWSKFLCVMPPEKQNLWKSIEHGLNHYFECLKQRENLDTECQMLRIQNAELKHLLKKN